MWLAWFLACSGSDSGEVTQAASPCEEETRADVLLPGLLAETGSMVVSIVGADPMPPIVGSNLWTVSAADTNGGLEGCVLDVEPDMPDHGHGGPSPQVQELGGGVYELSDLSFSMGGYWTVSMVITCPSKWDVAVFSVCVES